jgi:RNA recognition motif-containing protein
MVDRLNETNKSLWMGAVEPWMDENYLMSLFTSIAPTARILQVRIVRSATPTPGSTGCFAFIEFETHEQALRVLQTWNNKPYPKETNLPGVFRLGWAQNAATKNVPDYSIFIGDLPPGVTDEMLFDLFSSKYQSVRTAKIVTDKDTGQPKGYGFIRFLNEEESKRALVEMQGTYLLGKPIRLSQATPRRDTKPEAATAFITSTLTPGAPDPATYAYYMQLWYSQYMAHATQHWYGYFDPSSVASLSPSTTVASTSIPSSGSKSGNNTASSDTALHNVPHGYDNGSGSVVTETVTDSTTHTTNILPHNASVSTPATTSSTRQVPSTALTMYNVDEENELFIRDRMPHIALNPHFTPRLAVPSTYS